MTPWSWIKTLVECLRCGEKFLTLEASARCPKCGYVESVT